jgi:hypothetical protein
VLLAHLRYEQYMFSEQNRAALWHVLARLRHDY